MLHMSSILPKRQLYKEFAKLSTDAPSQNSDSSKKHLCKYE
jgi:hypothetical protein